MIGQRSHAGRWMRAWLASAAIAGAWAEDAATAPASTTAPARKQVPYKSMTLEELADVDVVTVTSVSRRPEPLQATASAVQVIGGDDIRRSGATSIPEALRLATNLQVAQVDSHDWAISARGFNNTLADKLLVRIDGRTVYTPLDAGVFWDVQDTLLADVERIEVISGPGATQWGANAVNGVINITTKSAKDTQGLYVEAGSGTSLRAFEAVRYGGRLGDDTWFRVYEKTSDYGNLDEPYQRDPHESLDRGQGGFRIDQDTSGIDRTTLQGDVYRDVIGQLGAAAIDAAGGNLLGRWTRRLEDDGNLQLQAYYDLAHRQYPNSITETLHTWDLDFQHRFRPIARNDVVWGVGYRVIHDDIRNQPFVSFQPATVTYQWFSAFLQDEIAVVRDRVDLSLGSKLEHNPYTGFETEPSGRLTWLVDRESTLWGAVSRAVRQPSRIDREFYVPENPPYLLKGGPDFRSEWVIAYELGYRWMPERRFSASLSTFYNDYHDVRSVQEVNPPAPTPLVVANGLEADTYGAELAIDARPIERLRLRAGYTELRERFRAKPWSTDTSNGGAEANDPKHQGTLWAFIDLTDRWRFDTGLRCVSAIENQQVPAYAELDARLAWLPTPAWELSLVGQNLLHDDHAEFGPPATRQEIGRSGYLKVVWRH